MKKKLLPLLFVLILNFEFETWNCFSQNSRIWATYYGGTEAETGWAVATDASGNVYLAGITLSPSDIAFGGFENVYSGGQDAFLVKFDAMGNRIWATYYWGPVARYGVSIASDPLENIYLAGTTRNISGIASGGFQNTFGGNEDAFLVKFDAAGNRLWATYYGELDVEHASSVTTDALGNVYLAGNTDAATGLASGGFQGANNGLVDAFLVKFDAGGNRLWATYYGGTQDDFSYSVATDKITGNVYLAGTTASTVNIASGGFQNTYGDGGGDAFLVKFDAAGNRLWATYYGGTEPEEIYNVVTDAGGNVYLAGDSYSDNTGNCIAAGGFQNSFIGPTPFPAGENQFVVKFDACGKRLCATYYGQNHDEEGHVAVDDIGNVYLAGRSNSISNFSSGGFQNTLASIPPEYDASLVKFTTCSSVLTVTTSSTNNSCNGSCSGTATAGAEEGCNNYSYLWNTIPAQTTQTATGLCAGTYTVIITDIFGATATATITITEPIALSATLTSTTVTCNGNDDGTATIAGNGGTGPYTYFWSNGQTRSIATGLITGTHTVIVSDNNGCYTIATVVITQPIAITFTIITTPDTCSSSKGTANILTIGEIYFYNWSNGQTTPNISSLSSADYSLTVTDNNGCTKTIDITIGSTGSATANAGPDVTIMQGSSTQLSASGGVSYTWTPSQNLSCTDCPDPIANPNQTTPYVVVVTDINGCTNTDTIIVNVETGCQEIFVPNAFSPNNDNQNDLECIVGNCIKSLNFIIYDRWGEKIFETNDPQICWNGTYNEKPMNTAVFIYSLNAKLISGEKIVKKGNISLIR